MSSVIPAYEVGRYCVTVAESAKEIAAAQSFRAAQFGLDRQRDADALDAACDHILIRDKECGSVVCCYRMLPVVGHGLSDCYAARYYDIGALQGFDGQLLELGRFCIDPARRDPDILRLAWAAMTASVDARNVTLLFGCSSFKGIDPAPYEDAFALLREKAVAPPRWAPGRKADEVYPFAADIKEPGDKRRALQQMPPLLRTYLGMGGWVSDHAVIDRHMNTLHVFTGVETAAIPPSRQRLLRALQTGSRPAG